jgi:hypothetical protein
VSVWMQTWFLHLPASLVSNDYSFWQPLDSLKIKLLRDLTAIPRQQGESLFHPVTALVTLCACGYKFRSTLATVQTSFLARLETLQVHSLILLVLGAKFLRHIYT